MITFSLNNQEVVDTVYYENTIKGADTEFGREYLGLAYLSLIDKKLESQGKVTGKKKSKKTKKKFETFDVVAWGKRVEQNQNASIMQDIVPLITPEEFDKGQQGAIIDRVATYVDENIDSIAETSELSYYVEQFLDMQDYLQREVDIDLWLVLRDAREGCCNALSMLKDLVKEFEMKDMIYSLLQDKVSLNMISLKMEGVGI